MSDRKHQSFWTCKFDCSTVAIESNKADACVDILMRENNYLNNIVEQDQRRLLVHPPNAAKDQVPPRRFRLKKKLKSF